MTTLLFVNGEDRALMLQRGVDPHVLSVWAIGRFPAIRADVVIVEPMPSPRDFVHVRSLQDWLEWVPTRLREGGGPVVRL